VTGGKTMSVVPGGVVPLAIPPDSTLAVSSEGFSLSVGRWTGGVGEMSI